MPRAPWILAWIAAAPLACAVTHPRPPAPVPPRPVAAAVILPPAPPALALDFSDFFQPGARLVPTEKALRSDGKRVRLVGFMARMELASARAFYLASRPLICDEAGGGTADLIPDAVRVEVPWARDPAIPFVPGPVEVVGTFHIGSHEEVDGRVSMFRVTLDPPPKPIADRDSFSDSEKSKFGTAKPNDSRS